MEFFFMEDDFWFSFLQKDSNHVHNSLIHRKRSLKNQLKALVYIHLFLKQVTYLILLSCLRLIISLQKMTIFLFLYAGSFEFCNMKCYILSLILLVSIVSRGIHSTQSIFGISHCYNNLFRYLCNRRHKSVKKVQ